MHYTLEEPVSVGRNTMLLYDFALLLKQYLSDTKLNEAKRAGFSLASRVENQPFLRRRGYLDIKL